MRAGPVVALLLLAGCVDPAPAPVPTPNAAVAKLWCVEGACNFEATLSPDSRQANELSIAVNPSDPLNIIATGKDYTPDEAGDCVWSGVYTTMDGGKTWKNQNVPGSPWKKLGNPNAPVNPDFSKFWCATDPVLAFSPDGKTAYWTVMPYQCDRASGSKTGRGVVPQGGFNDWFWTCSSMYVLVSHDGGLTWPEWKEVAFGPRLEHDKQWISTAPNGNVLLCWDRDPDHTGTGSPSEQVYPSSSHIACAVSKDKGKSWTPPTRMNHDWTGFLPSVDYDASNTAFSALITAKEIQVTRSHDGLAWSKPVTIGTYQNAPPGGEYGWPVLRGSDFRMVNVPHIAIDRSNGPFAGSVYVTWFDHSMGEGEIKVARSRDGGATWADCTRPMDDDPALTADQFYPALSVGPDGTVDVSWWDRRDDPKNHLFHVYYTYSKDGCETWAPNLRVSDVASDEQYSHHQNGMVFLGDYRDQDSSSMGAHLVWVDTRNNKADVYTAIVQR